MNYVFSEDTLDLATDIKWWEWIILPLLPSFSVYEGEYRFHFKALNGKLFLVKEEKLSIMEQG